MDLLRQLPGHGELYLGGFALFLLSRGGGGGRLLAPHSARLPGAGRLRGRALPGRHGVVYGPVAVFVAVAGKVKVVRLIIGFVRQTAVLIAQAVS